MPVQPADIRSIPLFRHISDERLVELFRVFETMTSWPCLIATAATACAIKPAPMIPIFT